MQITLVLALLVGTCSCIPDSVGTSFIFGFIRDAQPTSQTQTLSATVLNGNTGSCVFTLAYRDDYDETKNPLKYSTTTVPSMSSAEVSIPSWYGWQYDSPGMQVESGPHQLLTANSTCPVTVIANNYDSTTGQGDSFLVLPTTWAKAGPVFAFTLPPSNNDATNPGYQHISIIPTVKDVSGTLTVMGSSSLPFKAKFGDQPTSYFAKKTPQNEPHTYHVQADGPILLVAGVTCAGNYQHCDHASYMPQPLPTSACTDKPSLYDDHAAYTRITNGYYIDVPSTCSTNQNVTVYGNRATTWQNTPVSVTQQMPLRVFGPSFGEAITIHAETAPVHVTRYYDQSKNNKQGAFIDIVASISQFITGNSTFYTRNENDMIEVVCDINVCPFATIDGTLLMAHDKNFTNTGPIMGINYYTFSVIVPKKGFHYFGSSNTGLYSYYVIGQATNAAYGYIGPINQAKVEPIVVTTPAPTTSSPTGPTTIPASSTSPVPIVTTTTKATSTSTVAVNSSPSMLTSTVPPTKPPATSTFSAVTMTSSTVGASTSSSTSPPTAPGRLSTLASTTTATNRPTSISSLHPTFSTQPVTSPSTPSNPSTSTVPIRTLFPTISTQPASSTSTKPIRSSSTVPITTVSPTFSTQPVTTALRTTAPTISPTSNRPASTTIPMLTPSSTLIPTTILPASSTVLSPTLTTLLVSTRSAVPSSTSSMSTSPVPATSQPKTTRSSPVPLGSTTPRNRLSTAPTTPVVPVTSVSMSTTTKPTTTTAPTTMTTTTTTITTTTATTTTTTRPTTHTTKPPTTTTTPTPHPTTTTPSKPPPTKPSPATTPSPKTTTTQPTVPQPNTTVTIPVVVTTPAKSSTAPPPNPTTPSTTPLAETTSVSTTTPSTSTQIGSDLSSNMLFSLVILLLTTYLMS